MTYKIVSDSCCDIHALESTDFSVVPLHIITAEADYADDDSLDVTAMVTALKGYKGKSGTSCPNAAEWEAAFGDADAVFAVTITGALSGSYNAALCAKAQYEQQHPGRRVHVIDSLSTGPKVALILQKLRELIQKGFSYGQIVADITAYQHHTQLVFILSSVQNLARNGRISRLQADAVGLLGIRLFGQASDKGTLELLGKCRGEDAALVKAVLQLKKSGWEGGKVIITHCLNETGAHKLRNALHEICPSASIELQKTGGLCSFYAEAGGLLVGYETV